MVAPEEGEHSILPDPMPSVKHFIGGMSGNPRCGFSKAPSAPAAAKV